MALSVETPKFRLSDLISFHGYRQSAIAFLQYGTAVGAVFFVAGPLIAGMLPDVKWSLGVVSTALLVRGLLGMVSNPLAGWLVHRFGVRPVVVVGGLTTAVCTALTGLVRNPLEFGLVFGIALTLADSFMGYVPSATVVQNWFIGRRAAVMGFVNSGAGFGGLVFAPLMAVLVANLGWRHALFALAGIIFVLAIPSIFLRNRPQEVGQGVDGVPGRVIPEPGDEDVIGTVQRSMGQIVRSPVYWLLFAVFGVEAWSLATYATYEVLYLKTVGVSAAASSGALGIAAGIAAVSGLLFSRLSDRISPYYVLIISTISMTIGSAIFLEARGSLPLYCYSVLFGAGYGLLVPTIPVALSRYFGARNFAKAFGSGQILTSLMAAFGPYVTGQIVSRTGSFQLPMYLTTGLLGLSVVIAALARPPRHALRAVVPVAPSTSTADMLVD